MPKIKYPQFTEKEFRDERSRLINELPESTVELDIAYQVLVKKKTFQAIGSDLNLKPVQVSRLFNAIAPKFSQLEKQNDSYVKLLVQIESRESGKSIFAYAPVSKSSDLIRLHNEYLASTPTI